MLRSSARERESARKNVEKASAETARCLSAAIWACQVAGATDAASVGPSALLGLRLEPQASGCFRFGGVVVGEGDICLTGVALSLFRCMCYRQGRPKADHALVFGIRFAHIAKSTSSSLVTRNGACCHTRGSFTFWPEALLTARLLLVFASFTEYNAPHFVSFGFGLQV